MSAKEPLTTKQIADEINEKINTADRDGGYDQYPVVDTAGVEIKALYWSETDQRLELQG